MARKKTKKKTATMASTAKASAGGQGKRLTEDQKAAITAAGKTGATLSAIAQEHSVSMPTVRRLVGPRRGSKADGAATTTTGKRGRPAKISGTEGVTFTVEGGRITFSVAKHHPLAKTILADLTK